MRALDRFTGRIVAGSYRLDAVLGTGVHGPVYRAEHLAIGQSVAVRLVDGEPAAAAGVLDHPNAEIIHDAGVGDGIGYVAMELLRGVSLATLRGHAALPVGRALRLFSQVLAALEAAHAAGISHGELGPRRVHVVRQLCGAEAVKVAGFALRAGSPARDVQAAGALLHELVSGRALDPTRAAPPQLPFSSGPADLRELCIAALAPDESARPSAAEMRARVIALLRTADDFPACVKCGEPGLGFAYCGGCGAEIGAARRPTARQRPLSAAPPPRRAARATTPPGEAPLAGRDAEIARVRDFCTAPVVESPTLALTGPAGVGRARLVAEVAIALGGEVAVLSATPDPSGARAPWYPVRTMLEAVLGVRAPPAAAGRDAPGLAAVLGVPGPLDDATPLVRRREALIAAIRALREPPHAVGRIVLFFADVDRYDAASAHLVARLSAAVDGERVRMVTSSTDPASGMAGSLVVRIDPLADGAALELATHHAGAQVEAAVVAATGGMPGTIANLAAWLSRGGAPVDEDLRRVDLVALRIAALPAAWRRVLGAVALHGARVARPLAVATLAPGDEAAIAPLVAAHWLREADGEIAVPAALVAALRLGTPVGVRRALAERALVAADRLGIAMWSGVRAQLAERAGRHAEACRLHLAAGDDALRDLDDASAARHYRAAAAMARALVGAGAEGAAALVVDASVRIADALRLGGRLGLAAAALHDAQPHAAGPLASLALARAHGRLALAEADAERAFVQLDRALAHAHRRGDADLACEVAIELADALALAGAAERAIHELERAVEQASRRARAREPALVRLVELELDIGQLHAAAARAERALADPVGDATAARLCALLGRIADHAGDRHEAIRWRERAVELHLRLGDRRTTVELLRRNAEAAARLDDTAAAEAAQLRADQLAAEISVR